MQGSRSISTLFWAPEKAVVRQPLLLVYPFVGDHFFLPTLGPKEGGNATSSLHSGWSPTPSAGRKIRSVPQQQGKQTEVAASPLFSPGPKRGRKWYLTPTFSRFPNAKRAEENQKCSPTRGGTNTSGCLTPAFSGAQKGPELLRHTCILGGPHRQARGGKSEVFPNNGVNKQKWLPHPCFHDGPKEGGNATSLMHSRGSPTPSAGRKIRSVPQQRGKQTEVAASPLPSRGPKRGRKCYLTPAISGSPTPSAGRKIRSGPQ